MNNIQTVVRRVFVQKLKTRQVEILLSQPLNYLFICHNFLSQPKIALNSEICEKQGPFITARLHDSNCLRSDGPTTLLLGITYHFSLLSSLLIYRKHLFNHRQAGRTHHGCARNTQWLLPLALHPLKRSRRNLRNPVRPRNNRPHLEALYNTYLVMYSLYYRRFL